MRKTLIALGALAFLCWGCPSPHQKANRYMTSGDSMKTRGDSIRMMGRARMDSVERLDSMKNSDSLERTREHSGR